MYLPQVGRDLPTKHVAMLLAARTTLLDHREVAALLAAYGLFVAAVFGLTCAIV